MIDALIADRICGTPAVRAAKNGSRFATAKVRVSVREGETIFVNVIAFAGTDVDALLALRDGDSIALSRELTPKVWTDKNGAARPSLDLLAHAVLTVYAVQRKRKASTAAHGKQAADGAPFDDEVPI